jgi:hypothetical protein
VSEANIPAWLQNATTEKPAVQGPNVQILPSISQTPVEAAADGEDSLLPLTICDVIFPREASQRIRSMNPEERAAWDADRFKCLTDQLFLAGILGFDLVENPHAALFARFLKKQPGVNLSSLETQFKKRMVLWQRGAAKTSCIRDRDGAAHPELSEHPHLLSYGFGPNRQKAVGGTETNLRKT